MIQEVLNDNPSRNTWRKKRQKVGKVQCKNVLEKIKKHVPQGYYNNKPALYCYTHGITTNITNKICSCTCRGDDHKEDVTLKYKKVNTKICSCHANETKPVQIIQSKGTIKV